MTRPSVLAGKFSCCQVIDARKVVAFYSDGVERQQRSTQVAAAQQWWDHPLWRWLKPCQIALTCVKWIPAIFAKLTHRTPPGCGIMKMTSELRDGFAGGKVCRACERASERLSTRPPPPGDAPNTNKEKWSGNAAVLRLHSLPCMEANSSVETERQERKKRKEKQRREEKTSKLCKALLACSKPVCMRRKSRSLHSQAFSCRSRSEPSRSPGASPLTWTWSSDTRCSASCTRVARCTARPSRLTTGKHKREREKDQTVQSVGGQGHIYDWRCSDFSFHFFGLLYAL